MDVKVNVHVTGFLRDPEKAVNLASAEMLAENARWLADEVRAAAPRRTGKLANAFQITDVLPYGRDRVAVRFYFDREIAPYWESVIYGREAESGGVITPTDKQALAFHWDEMGFNPRTEDGRWIFKNVDQSAMKANPFVREAFRSAASRLTNRAAEDFIVFLRR